MRVTAEMVSKLTDMEILFGLPYLSILLLAKNKNSSAIKIFCDKLKIDMETALFMVKQIEKEVDVTLSDEESIVLKAFQQKQKRKLPAQEEKFLSEAKLIMEHFNQISGSRLSLTEKRKKNITKWLKKGFTKEDFFGVHVYFFELWGNNPKMIQYFRPSTLYNTKFEDRVAESKEAIELVFSNKKSIENVINAYQKVYFKVFGKNPKDTASVSFDILKTIGFWLKKGYSEETLQATVEKSVLHWSKKQELIPYISLAKIFDSKFPERVQIAQNSMEKIKSSGTLGRDSLETWMQTRRKSEQ